MSCTGEGVIILWCRGSNTRVFKWNLCEVCGEWFLVVSIFGILLLEMIGCEGNVLEDGGCCCGNIEDVFCEKIYF